MVIEIAQIRHRRPATTRRAKDPGVLDRRPASAIGDRPSRAVAGAYQRLTTFGDGASIHPLLCGAPAIDVTALLG
jgi:hypothetical protein